MEEFNIILQIIEIGGIFWIAYLFVTDKVMTTSRADKNMDRSERLSMLIAKEITKETVKEVLSELNIVTKKKK